MIQLARSYRDIKKKILVGLFVYDRIDCVGIEADGNDLDVNIGLVKVISLSNNTFRPSSNVPIPLFFFV